MREILFRGKFGNEWVYGYLSVEPKGLVIKSPYTCGQSNIWHIDPETVGQYIGLIDKNGTRIFEGDIIKDDWGKIYKVFYSLKSCSFMLECTKTPNEWEKGHYRIGEAWCKTIRVIGNIHDNPELLEGTK